MSTGHFLHQSWCYNSVRTNAISVLFAKKKGGGGGGNPPKKADSLGRGWAQCTRASHQPRLDTVTRLGWGLTTSQRGLGLIATIFHRGRANGGRGTEKVPRGHCQADAACAAPSVLSEERPLISEWEMRADGQAGARLPPSKRSYI